MVGIGNTKEHTELVLRILFILGSFINIGCCCSRAIPKNSLLTLIVNTWGRDWPVGDNYSQAYPGRWNDRKTGLRWSSGAPSESTAASEMLSNQFPIVWSIEKWFLVRLNIDIRPKKCSSLCFHFITFDNEAGFQIVTNNYLKYDKY